MPDPSVPLLIYRPSGDVTPERQENITLLLGLIHIALQNQEGMQNTDLILRYNRGLILLGQCASLYCRSGILFMN